MKQQEKHLVVRVARWDDGSLYSEVVNTNAPSHFRETVVIDRVKGRHLDKAAVISRAKSLAKLLDLPFEEDYTWPCAALKKMRCSCPECVKRGNDA